MSPLTIKFCDKSRLVKDISVSHNVDEPFVVNILPILFVWLAIIPVNCEPSPINDVAFTNQKQTIFQND